MGYGGYGLREVWIKRVTTVSLTVNGTKKQFQLMLVLVICTENHFCGLIPTTYNKSTTALEDFSYLGGG